MKQDNLLRATGLALCAFASACATHDPVVVRERTEALYGGDLPPTPAAEPADERERRAEVAAREPRIDPSAPADLDLYLRYGLRHNGRLRAAFERWRAARQRIPQVSTLPDPVFSFAQFVEEVQTRTGPQERRYGLSQTVPWFGELDQRAEVATRAAEAEWYKVEAVRLTVSRDIFVAYHEYAYLAQSIRITQGVLNLLRQLDPVVQRRIAGGAGGQGDLLRLQVEIGRVENELASLRQVRPSLNARLVAAMSLERDGMLPLPELAEPDLADLDTAALLRRADRHNPDLRELAELAAKSREARELAGFDRWPDLTFGVDYIETGDAVAPTPGSGNDPLALRVMFNLPIWGSRYAAAEREAERQEAAALHALRDRRQTLRADLEHAVFRIDDAARQVVLYRETLLPRAREALEVTRASYRAGEAMLLDLIDSERALLEFETGYWRACRDHHQNQARLWALVGDQAVGGER